MKKFYIIMLTAAAAVALVSCTKEQPAPEESLTPAMKTITITTDVRTKTTLDAGHDNLVWSSGDKISVFNNVNNTNASLTYAPSGYMTVEVPVGTTEVYGHYPYYSSNTSGPSSVSIYISKNQTQTNPGELAGYYYPMVAKGTVTGDNKANMIFYPVASALAINLYHTGLAETETVSKVVVTPTANSNFIGGQDTDITGAGVTYASTSTSAGPITVTLTNALTLGNTKPSNSQTFAGQIYACLAKQSYTAVNFEITTSKGTYSITSNLTAMDCVNNDFVPVNIDLNVATFTPKLLEPSAVDGWYRVEDASWLAAGDRVAIVANGYNYAMAPTQQANYRDRIAITKGTDGDYTTLSSYAGIQEFILETGTVAGSFGFWCDNGATANQYLYASSSSANELKSRDELDEDDNASFTIISAGSGAMTVTAKGTNTRNLLKYNDTNTRFACYGSGQNDVAIYKRYGGSTPTCVAPTIDQEGSTITLSTTTPGAKIHYTTDGSTPTGGSTVYSAPFVIAANTTVKAIAIRSHYNNSVVTSEDLVPAAAKCATPVITPHGSWFEISCATEGATIYYEISTTDMASVATPTSGSTSYSTDVATTATTYVKAIAVKDTYTDSDVATATVTYTAPKSYSFTIQTSDFNTTSYAANNNEKHTTATASDSSTIEVYWTSNQVMQSSSVMQWQRNAGYIYNSTNLGTITAVTINSTAGTFTTNYGDTVQPTSSTTPGGHFFKITVGNATGKTNSIVVTFTK